MTDTEILDYIIANFGIIYTDSKGHSTVTTPGCGCCSNDLSFPEPKYSGYSKRELLIEAIKHNFNQ